ncbi:hypothetical protein [Lysobacter xanthus]
MAASSAPAPARRNWHPLPWGLASALLLLPAVAMRFDTGVNWTGFDFAVAAVLLYGTCALYEVAARLSRDRMYRAGAAVAVVTGLLLVWVNLAVGIIGSERNPANLVFAVVLGIAAAGAIGARLRARGMAAVLAVTAFAQAVAAVYALVGGHDARGMAAAGMFVPMWLASAWLFDRAAKRTHRRVNAVDIHATE